MGDSKDGWNGSTPEGIRLVSRCTYGEDCIIGEGREEEEEEEEEERGKGGRKRREEEKEGYGGGKLVNALAILRVTFAETVSTLLVTMQPYTT